jgi:hypothetical protein
VGARQPPPQRDAIQCVHWLARTKKGLWRRPHGLQEVTHNGCLVGEGPPRWRANDQVTLQHPPRWFLATLRATCLLPGRLLLILHPTPLRITQNSPKSHHIARHGQFGRQAGKLSGVRDVPSVLMLPLPPVPFALLSMSPKRGSRTLQNHALRHSPLTRGLETPGSLRPVPFQRAMRSVGSGGATLCGSRRRWAR